MYTQRKKERRGFCGKMLFPLVTNEGYEVEKDRRSTPDRRLGNVHLELAEAGTCKVSAISGSYSQKWPETKPA